MDKYDEAIQYLTKHSNEIYDIWADPQDHSAGCLFQFVADGGCLTQIRKNFNMMKSDDYPDISKQISLDESIPCHPQDIKVQSLPHFARWQRILDVELNRK